MDSYEQNLQTLQEHINNLSERIKKGRIKDVHREELRLKQYRTLGYLCRIQSEMRNDIKTGEIEQEIEIIKKMIKDKKIKQSKGY